MTATVTKLIGQALLDYVNSNQTLNRVELCTGAGYYPSFTDFYVAILDARNANGEYTSPTNSEYNTMNGRDWYEDVLDDQGRDLYDMIEDRCPEFSKLDAEQCQEFMDELSEIDITTAEQFEDAYYMQFDSYKAEAEFAEEFMCQVTPNLEDSPIFFAIDWQRVWEHSLYYDFNTIEFDGSTYFFRNN